ncbi:putative vacuolar amino acid transporter [Lachnellula willkommii]|uniref:Putative vacuolar amino acid transporter n=1 Tax=Lachnellula willkommii TaxID=215461 RepID=A0A559ML73_9HELO|nr:putative vacuolar amino acid transporter [Lachnellula willkommii]
MSSAMALSQALLPQEALSGIFGSISLATWIFLLPGERGGAIWADLVPTVIALAIYFCIADLVLISQCLYYNHINAQRRQSSVISEHEPLLARRRSSDTIGLPGSHRRRSSARSGTSQHSESPLSKILEENEEGTGNQWVKNSLSALGVIVVGTAGWAIAWQAGVWKPSPLDVGVERASETALGAKILGYTSAICYLGARIPQIVKNYKDKSCDGLALLFFLLSLMGNATYGAGILFHSIEKDYVMLNLPWLIGSLGTIAEDAIIFVQFRLYSTKQTTEAVVE